MKVKMAIREMLLADIPAILEIDQASFPTPWTEEVYRHELTNNEYAKYFVVDTEEEIVGYIGLWIVLEDAQVTNIAIRPNYRGYKIGEKLFGFAVSYLMEAEVQRLSLEVRESNKIAQNMYRKFGLVAGGLRKNYYKDNGEDALLMWVNLR